MIAWIIGAVQIMGTFFLVACCIGLLIVIHNLHIRHQRLASDLRRVTDAMANQATDEAIDRAVENAASAATRAAARALDQARSNATAASVMAASVAANVEAMQAATEQFASQPAPATNQVRILYLTALEYRMIRIIVDNNINSFSRDVFTDHPVRITRGLVQRVLTDLLRVGVFHYTTGPTRYTVDDQQFQVLRTAIADIAAPSGWTTVGTPKALRSQSRNTLSEAVQAANRTAVTPVPSSVSSETTPGNRQQRQIDI